jgi:hypothetical protein
MQTGFNQQFFHYNPDIKKINADIFYGYLEWIFIGSWYFQEWPCLNFVLFVLSSVQDSTTARKSLRWDPIVTFFTSRTM